MSAPPPTSKQQLAEQRVEAVLREQLPTADETQLRFGLALCGLVASIAFIDRRYAQAEREHLRRALSFLPQASSAALEAIASALEAELEAIAVLDPSSHAAAVRGALGAERCQELLELLAELAASDGAFTLIESDSLRRAGSALGLEPSDVQRIEARHRAGKQRLG